MAESGKQRGVCDSRLPGGSSKRVGARRQHSHAEVARAALQQQCQAWTSWIPAALLVWISHPWHLDGSLERSAMALEVRGCC